MSQLNSSLRDWRICSPPCLEVHSGNDLSSIQQAVIRQGLTFPLICKTRVAHGSYSHEMCLLFSAASLADIHPPCVLQSFVNHGAVLYKVFVVGDKHCCVERPSIKNFPSGPCDRRTIFFNSQKVSKPESNSDLTSVDEHMVDPPSPSSDAVAALVKELRAQLGMALFGVDVIINIGTHALTVIDINIFPGYEGMPQFFSSLLSHIQSVLDKHAAAGSHTTGGSSEETVGVCHPRSWSRIGFIKRINKTWSRTLSSAKHTNYFDLLIVSALLRSTNKQKKATYSTWVYFSFYCLTGSIEEDTAGTKYSTLIGQ